MTNSVLNRKVSCFDNYQGTEPHDVNLLEWLRSETHREKVENLRNIQDEDLQNMIKSSLPAISASGSFSYRSTEHFIEHSGFLAFDIDYKDNTHISNWKNLKEQVSHIKCVAYCGVSVRGKGYWGLVRIPKCSPLEHKKRFEALSHDFKAFGIELDNQCSDITRLRTYSYDPHPFINHQAEVYQKIWREPETLKRVYPKPNHSDTQIKVESIIQQIIQNQIDITTNYKEEWFTLAAALANEFGEVGRGYFHTISQFNTKYNREKSNRQYDRCLKHRYNKITIGSFFKIAGDYGIRIVKQELSCIRKNTINNNEENLSKAASLNCLKEKVITDQRRIMNNKLSTIKQQKLSGFIRWSELVSQVQLNKN